MKKSVANLKITLIQLRDSKKNKMLKNSSRHALSSHIRPHNVMNDVKKIINISNITKNENDILALEQNIHNSLLNAVQLSDFPFLSLNSNRPRTGYWSHNMANVLSISKNNRSNQAQKNEMEKQSYIETEYLLLFNKDVLHKQNKLLSTVDTEKIKLFGHVDLLNQAQKVIQDGLNNPHDYFVNQTSIETEIFEDDLNSMSQKFKKTISGHFSCLTELLTNSWGVNHYCPTTLIVEMTINNEKSFMLFQCKKNNVGYDRKFLHYKVK